MLQPRIVTIHCSDTPNKRDVDISEINEWHVKRGWKKCGYHAVIKRSGEVQDYGKFRFARSLNEQGAHAAPFNLAPDHRGDKILNIGICLIGRNKFTFSQFDALYYYLNGLEMCYDFKVSRDLRAHYEFNQLKSCPNMWIGRLVGWYCTGDWEVISEYLEE